MSKQGGCYCGDIRYRIEGEPMQAGQCHCRDCQYFSGGHSNVVMIFSLSAFAVTQGEVKHFTRADKENAVTRGFCGNCGTQLFATSPYMPDGIIVKVGTLDDPSVFSPEFAIWTSEKQTFHSIPEGIADFSTFPEA